MEYMIEIRFHGRGGQGAVTCAQLLAQAAGLDNKFSQGFPAFGPERRGAPVKAFCRIDDRPITTRAQVYSPDYVVVLDCTLVSMPEVAEGLKPETIILVNSAKKEKAGSGITKNFDATKLAIEKIGKPIVNTVMMGAFIKMSGLVTLESLKKVTGERFPGKVGEANQEMVVDAYNRFSG